MGDEDGASDGADVRVNRVALARPSLAGLDLGGSLLDLRRQSEVISREELKKLSINQSLTDDKCTLGPKSTAYKNLFGLALSYLAVFGAYLGIQALQSSLNQEANLGLTSLCVLNGCFMISTLITPTVIRLVGTKYSLIGGYVVFLLYTVCNAYPDWYTLIPSSFLLGIAFGPVWASLNTHATNVAIKYAPAFNQKAQHLIILFSGVVSFHIQLAQAFGNLISSLVLISCDTSNATITMTDNFTNNITASCDSSEYCNNTSALTLDRVCLYVLLAVYATMDLIGIITACTMLDRTKTDTQFFSRSQIWKIYVKEPLIEIFRATISWKMLLLIPPTLFNGMELAFIAGRFSQTFVSECVGVQWVGFASMAFGLASAVGALSSGFLVKWIPEHFIMLVGYTNNITLTLFLLFWERMPNFAFVFLFPIFWGLSDGLWNTLIPGIVGVQFTNRLEAGFSVMRTFLAAGFLIGFFTARSDICTSYQLWGYFTMILLAAGAIITLATLTKKKHQLLPCCFKKERASAANDESLREANNDASLREANNDASLREANNDASLREANEIMTNSTSLANAQETKL